MARSETTISKGQVIDLDIREPSKKNFSREIMWFDLYFGVNSPAAWKKDQQSRGEKIII